MVLWVGLTGGIGSGKSAVARRLAELGAVIIDSDLLAREAVSLGTPGLAQVVEAFGPSILTAAGELDRQELGRRVFGDDDARGRLESIIHPLVRARVAELAAAAPPGAVVVNDVPLLVEKGLAATYAKVIVVFASEEVRIARLIRDRGMTAEEAKARIAAQADDAARRAVADYSIVNDGTLEDLQAQIDRLWAELNLSPA